MNEVHSKVGRHVHVLSRNKKYDKLSTRPCKSYNLELKCQPQEVSAQMRLPQGIA
jgi:hypothetical protein